MTTINIREYEETFVIHFGSEFKSINAYTLASTLVSLANAAKEANSIINPGYEIEIVVEAIGSGSFRTRIRTIYKSVGNIFSKKDLKAIVLSLIAAFIYQHVLAPDVKVEIVVNKENVIIESGDQKIIIPKEVHDAMEEMKNISSFTKKIDQTFDAVTKDANIKSLGITKNMNDEKPSIEIPRERFPVIAYTEEEKEFAIITEMANLKILKAILDWGKRKWEFVWRGITISAPVLDPNFYNDFYDHVIKIAPGDSLEAEIKIYQKKDPNSGVYINDRYEVVKIHKLIPKFKQSRFNNE